MQYLNSLPGKAFDDQVVQLQKASENEAVHIRVPTGFHAAMGPQFTIITPATVSESPGVPFVYLESNLGCRYIEDSTQKSEFDAAFEKSFLEAQPLEEYLNA